MDNNVESQAEKTKVNAEEVVADTSAENSEVILEADLSKDDSSDEKIKSFTSKVKSFRKIMIRALVVYIVKAILVGLAVALPIFGLLSLFDRFEITALGAGWIYPISICVFLLSSAGMFFILRQSKKSIAMRLDREYKLNEKVQTMLAFKDEEGPMYDLQRQDASEAIASVGGSVLGIKRLWIYILCFIVSVGMCVVSFLFNPLPDPPPPPEEVPFQATELQLTALSNLIEYVNDSEMQDPYKTSISQVLTTLLDEIKVADTINKRDEAIAKAMDELYLQTDKSSEAVELMNELWATNTTTAKKLAQALNYYEWPKSSEWEKLVEKMGDLESSFAHPDIEKDDADEQKIIDDTKNVMLMLSISILSSIEKSELDSEDALCIALVRLASANEENADGTRIYGMKVLSDYIVANGYTKALRELNATIKGLNGDIYKALSQHSVNTGTGEYAMSTVAGIFGVEAPKFKRPDLNESSSDSTGDGEGAGSEGGISGGPSYGSDDKVYDPYTNRYVEYGTILDKYYSLMFSKLEGGSYTDDEKKALEEYFKILYGGFEDDTNENE